MALLFYMHLMGYCNCSADQSFTDMLSLDTILSLQLLLQFSRDFDETFQLLFPWPEDDHILSRSCSTDFYQSYSPLANRPSVETILSPQLLLQFQSILMKLSSYCSHDLKMMIFYRGHAWLIFTRVIALWQFFNSKSCLCNFSCSFQWI